MRLKYQWKITALVAVAMALAVGRARASLSVPRLPIPYGNNPAVGHYATVNGIRLYYEIYGDGPPILMIHGNGGSIAFMGNQIQFFSAHYRVIAADSCGHGKSDLGTGVLTYEQQADDIDALVDKLRLKSVDVLGWSDGGIIGLLLAIHHPDKVSRLAVMGANISPDGAYEWALRLAQSQATIVDQKIAKGDLSRPWALYRQRLNLVLNQPHIPIEDLRKILAPTLVMAGDRDVIRDDHTLLIFHNIPLAQLAIFPGSTHMILWQNPVLLDSTVDKFFSAPFTRPDTRDLFK